MRPRSRAASLRSDGKWRWRWRTLAFARDRT
jgi:hypothetical protein